jgi:DNA invertase Pin-like site-specific DNA recombinase/uncharacterized ubiquitin-like protein YukD
MEIRVIQSSQKLAKRLNVAAYARVSKTKDSLLHSLDAQVTYYRDLIRNNKQWCFKGVYADEGISGNRDNREQFQRLLEECRKGNIDLILTKSISRFARNTVTLLKVTRELKAIGVDVYFEEQQMHSLSEEGEFMLSLLASMAQEESRSMSENIKWRVLERFNKGELFSMTILGYRLKDGVLQIEPNEAEIVKYIYKRYLDGEGILTITKELRSKGWNTRFGNSFTLTGVRTILKNEVYTGDLVLQKTYRENFMTKMPKKNTGQKKRWVVKEAHEPIISKDIFNKVKKEMAKRHDTASTNSVNPKKNRYPFSLMITCSHCGRHYIRGKNLVRYLWRCTTFTTYGKEACPSKSIPEEVLIKLTNEVLNISEFDENLFKKQVKQIVVQEDGSLLYQMTNGDELLKTWEYKTRSQCWTPEKRAAMSELLKKKNAERRAKNG